MLTLSELHIEHVQNMARVVCTIHCDGKKNIFGQKTMWFAVPEENECLLSDKTYDPFFPISLYLAMYYHTDLCIKGKVSKKLYKNLRNYCQRIYSDFSDDLQKRINITVDGFTVVEKRGSMIGTGISCGVDSFSTIWERYANETDDEYKINSLFFFDFGSCGDYGKEETRQLFFTRYKRSTQVADELGLPLYRVDSNVHAFSHGIGGIKIGGLALLSCVLSLQSAVSKYYISSAGSYTDVLKYTNSAHDYSINEWAESYLTPLIQTDSIEIVLDGSQYQKTEKIMGIADWEIAHKYLNVCVDNNEEAKNCSKCVKCLRTLLALDYMGKLDNFKNVFDLDIYYASKYAAECECIVNYGKDQFLTDIADLAFKYNIPLPSKRQAYKFIKQKRKIRIPAKRKLKITIVIAFKKLLGEERYRKWKKRLRNYKTWNRND